MAVTYALGTESTYKAGANVSSTAVAAPQLLAFGLMVEGTINVATQFDWSAWYTTNGATYPHVSQILIDCATNLMGFYIINYDESGFVNIQEATDRKNALYALYISQIAILKEEAKKDFIGRFGV